MKTIKRLLELLEHIKSGVDLLLKDKDILYTSDLIRNKLGSISLGDVRKDIQMSKDERKEYVARIHGIFKDIIEPKCKKFITMQEEFMARETEGEIQFLVGRGTINGILLILEDFEKDNLEHIENMKEDSGANKPNDIHSVIGEIL